ncbi:MAG TPA: hypothetical protein VG870_15175 [Chitinophagaceae bacterium]|nr:hypothetical protein [Chitinophagaceae bacterium]
MKKIMLALGIFAACQSQAQWPRTLFESSGGTQTPTYPQLIRWWQQLDRQSPRVALKTMGMTDAGYPLHLVIVSADGDADLASLRSKHRHILLIINGIHPGEPDGIDASMLLVRDIASGAYSLPRDIALAIIPVYNIGGCLNRSADYRVDQNGPEAFGFRGNSQNLDLNRDFIKCDSRDARAFTEIFHLVDPDVMVDNHVSDGADYQHVMTLICSQHDKLGGEMGSYMSEEFEPGLHALMKQKGYDLVPYVNDFDETPQKGWAEFFDSPRYSSGFGTLWSTFSFIPETHMLKPYSQRVRATYDLMQCFIAFTSAHGDRIRELREKTRRQIREQALFPISWTLDTTSHARITFKGYESGHKPSEVSGQPRLYYDRSKPYTAVIPFYNYYRPQQYIRKPRAYLIPQGWWKVVELLRLNGVKMQPLPRDTTLVVEVYHIDQYQTYPRPYEGHHPNSNVQVTVREQNIHFRKGDLLIPMNQDANRFLVETLEPQAEDSYFAWNFFDPVLGQKEGYSAYSFEDIAAGYLRDHPEVRALLEQRRAEDSAFARSGPAQLNFVFRHSPYYEPDHLRYPVYRIP